MKSEIIQILSDANSISNYLPINPSKPNQRMNADKIKIFRIDKRRLLNVYDLDELIENLKKN